MRIIDLPDSGIRANANYQRHVIESGHRPGVLSGAELQGRAKTYGAGYARSRNKATRVAAQHGVTDGLLLIDSRWCRVWMDSEGRPVKLNLV